MPLEVTACRTPDEITPAITPIFHYFGIQPTPPDAERFQPLIEPSRAFAARIDGEIVGGCASFPFELSVPGGTVRAAGLTVVGVLPTHRRRGVLRAMMRAHLDDTHRRGEPIGYLWASEDTIYGRFGYGLASFCGNVDVSKAHTAFTAPAEARGEFRLVDVDTAVADMARVYDRVWREHPGMYARSADWWRLRRLADPEHRRMGAGLHNRVVMYEAGEPRAYAIYRLNQKFENGTTAGHVLVLEAIGVDARAMRDIWRFVFDIDWVARVKANLLSLDHPLLSLVARPRDLGFRMLDGVWVRLVDVPAALAARTYGAGEPVVVELSDAFCPWNAGRWRLSSSGAERTTASAELACDVTELGSVYLGGLTFRRLARAGRIEERRDGALARADALFATDCGPWCPEIF